MDLNHRLLVPNQASESHKRFIWRRLRDKKRYPPLLVVPNLYLAAPIATLWGNTCSPVTRNQKSTLQVN